MNRKAAEPILDCEGAMGEVFPSVFKTRIPPLMYIHREHRVWMVVTTNRTRSPLDLIQHESFFKHATEDESVEFLWKTSGPFDMAIRQFRLDFLRHLSDEILSAQIRLAIYLEADVVVGQQASSALASSLARAVEAAGHGSMAPSIYTVKPPVQTARVIDARSQPQPEDTKLKTAEHKPLEKPPETSSESIAPENFEIESPPEAVEPPLASSAALNSESLSTPEPEPPLDSQLEAENQDQTPDEPSAPEIEPDPPRDEVRWEAPKTPAALPSWAEPPWPDSAEKANVEASRGAEANEAEEADQAQTEVSAPQPVSQVANVEAEAAGPPASARPLALSEKLRPQAEAVEDLLLGNFYQDYYGFEHMPFNNTPDSFFFFPTEKHQEALSRLIYAISERKGFVVISGEIGAGKTTLCRTLLTQLPRAVKIALITHTHLDSDQLIRAIAEDLDIQTEGLDRREIIASLNHYLIEQLAQNCTVCIIIDEAQNLSPMVLEEVRMISNLETEQEKLVQLILLGQPELRDKLKDPTLKQLRQRIAVQYHLAPLNLEETISYISHRLKIAAPASELHFNRAAMQEAFQYSGGVPRLINTLCDNALLTCFTRGQRKITPKIIREAARDLALEPQEVGFWQMWKFW